MANANIIQFPEPKLPEGYLVLSPEQLSNIIQNAVFKALEAQEEASTPKEGKLPSREEERLKKASSVKSNGVKKATAAVPIKDVKQIREIRDYLLYLGDTRSYAVFSVGLTLGIRVRDLLVLKVRDFLNEDGTFKERLDIIEMKTDKRNRPLITEYAKDAILKYLSERKDYELDEPMFVSSWRDPSIKKSKPMSLSMFNKRLNQAGEHIGLHLSSHCMRHTFSYMMNTHATSETEEQLSYMSLVVTQIAMNHASLAQTLAYTGLSQDMMDEKRRSISDFLMKNT